MFLESRARVGISCLVVAFAAMSAVGCESSAGKASDAGGAGGSGGKAGTAGGCVDKVGADYHVSDFFNYPDGICDTYGSFTLTVAAPSTLLTNGTFFRVDSTGTNLNSSAGHFSNGVWTTQPDAQNVPGNYVAHLFIATTANPGESDFLPEPWMPTLATGVNTFYYFADSDDQIGGSYGFGLNLWLNAAPAASPGISALAVPPGGAATADATTGCSPAFDGTCTASADSLSWSTGGTTVTLTSFFIDGVGGANAPVDAGASD